MKILLPTLLILASTLAVGSSAPAPQDAQSAAAMEDMLRPGPQHAMLQKFAGNWDTVIVLKPPTGAEQRTKGTMNCAKHTDFHTIDSFEGELMGMKFLGHGINGYCPVKKKYFTLWTDSMTPSPLSLEGDYDAATKELTMTGAAFGMSGKLEPCRTVTRYQDDDHYTFTMFGPGPDGKEVQHLAIEYTRKK
jgi:hypothetical protein